MKKLDTIQKENVLNSIYAVDEPGPGGAYHKYIIRFDKVYDMQTIKFQCGPRNEENSTNGALDSDLLEIVRDRLTSFQDGEYACEFNKVALYHVEEALKALNKRVEDRTKRNVLGTNNK